MADEENGNTAQDELDPDATDEPTEQGAPVAGQSFLRGLRDAAAHMLSEARAEASRAKDEAWERYESKTKYRRKRD